jgi:hypothetical protein
MPREYAMPHVIAPTGDEFDVPSHGEILDVLQDIVGYIHLEEYQYQYGQVCGWKTGLQIAPDLIPDAYLGNWICEAPPILPHETREIPVSEEDHLSQMAEDDICTIDGCRLPLSDKANDINPGGYCYRHHLEPKKVWWLRRLQSDHTDATRQGDTLQYYRQGQDMGTVTLDTKDRLVSPDHIVTIERGSNDIIRVSYPGPGVPIDVERGASYPIDIQR